MILICDDDHTIRASLTLVLKRAGYEEVHGVSSPSDAIALIRTRVPSIILMDMNYTLQTSGEEGLELLSKVKVLHPEIPVILITAWGSIELAVRGMKIGAYDFITKPWNNLSLLNVIRTALELNKPEDGKEESGNVIRPAGIIGKSPLLEDILTKVNRIAPTNASVLITGESGTGKELIAQAIHACSKRKEAAFVKVNLGGVSQSLFESEMFGHKKGAFTDAQYDRTGRFEVAHKGTIFLDEIGELDPGSQVKLLRVLQDQTFESLGDSRPRQVDVRVISATNRDLGEMISRGDFREDLFYRINLINIHLPPLRERVEDIPMLVRHFANRLVKTNRMDPVRIEPDAQAFLKTLPYPGNIRELKNLVERTILMSGKTLLSADDFREQCVETALHNATFSPPHFVETIERQMIFKALKMYNGNISKVSAVLGYSRQALYRKIEKYNINKELE